MAARAERKARNEALFREVNERRAAIDRQARGGWADPTELFEFVCECGVEGGCEGRVQMTLEEYESVRQQDDRFPVVPGHESPEIETVVERNERYVVVDKHAEFEPLVEDDPRGAPSQ
ncbi:MAG TPA: hypothetical protein VGQ15_10665 [Gaiellaceae bacterium]|nr:hypothetical protein [Gaiellaceae bacterium]